jgi:hypothetical protein
LVKVLLYPGLIVQMITTKQPTDDMIEVAIVSMEQALEADGQPVPAGSGDFAREPLQLGLSTPGAGPTLVPPRPTPSPLDPPPGS